eukprot:TRINITY_DN1329_c0_g1_i1.p1 TRINITY_DN1329_c0_g1~~TRINITY_DN1329_c0_g1_i1.p1  ORF type:complete len:560 (-),score=85.89 TRINITY_DN1329_c0_g1_i1:189-1868(-)
MCIRDRVSTQSTGTNIPQAIMGRSWLSVLVVFSIFFAGVSAKSRRYPPENVDSTRPQDIMEIFEEMIIAEGKQPTQACVINGEGPGIFTPPGVARSFRRVAQAMYNGWAITDPVAKMDINMGEIPIILEGSLLEYQEVVITIAAYYVIQNLVPERTAAMDLAGIFLTQFDVDVGIIGAIRGSASHCGHRIAQGIIVDMLSDGSNQQNCYVDNTNYVPPTDPTDLSSAASVEEALDNNRGEFLWSQIVRPGYIDRPRGFLMPHAGAMKPYAYTGRLAPPLPPRTQLVAEYQAVSDIQQGISDQDKINAEYWADGPRSNLPPGHNIDIARENIINPANYNFEQSLLTIYLAANALYDAGIAAWNTKRFYNSVRPATYITTFLGINTTLTNQYRGPYCPNGDIQAWQWQPYQASTFVTPPFPEYISGHSSFSKAVTHVLKLWTGSNFLPEPVYFTARKGESLFEPQCASNGMNMYGEPCEYQSCAVDGAYNSENNYSPKEDTNVGPWLTFDALADAAGYSRLQGGIHISAGNIEGLEIGAHVARKVFARFKYYTGRESAHST